ncbi:MAG: hypothetical protein HZB51_04550 [Chloroflexi bacterium]|nr:hypothetical protein [Chloroflexota bacterium]
MRVIHPHHPLFGQIVPVLRPYHRQAGESQIVIPLPDGTQTFIAESWTEPVAASLPTSPSVPESPTQPWVNATSLLSLAKLVVAFKANPDPERSPSHVEHLTPARDDP